MWAYIFYLIIILHIIVQEKIWVWVSQTFVGVADHIIWGWTHRYVSHATFLQYDIDLLLLNSGIYVPFPWNLSRNFYLALSLKVIEGKAIKADADSVWPLLLRRCTLGVLSM